MNFENLARELYDELVSNGREEEAMNILRMHLVDNNNEKIDIGDKVIYIGPEEDGIPFGQEMEIDCIMEASIGEFTTIELGTRFFSGSEVVKKR